MTVSRLGQTVGLRSLSNILSAGEILEKVTRILTPEERALLDMDWVGRNGTKRKMEVSCLHLTALGCGRATHGCVGNHGPTKAEEIAPIRD